MSRHVPSPLRGNRYDLKHPMAYLDASLRVACIEAGVLTAGKVSVVAGCNYDTARRWWTGRTPPDGKLLDGLLRYFNLHLIPVAPETLPQMPLAVDSILELCIGEK